MVDQQEKLWTFDAVEPGQVGNETVVEITAENIAEYARLALNPSDTYQPAASGRAAMPTMVLSYAPLLREEIAEANGFVAFEVPGVSSDEIADGQRVVADRFAVVFPSRLVGAVDLEEMSRLFVRKDDVQDIDAVF